MMHDEERGSSPGGAPGGQGQGHLYPTLPHQMNNDLNKSDYNGKGDVRSLDNPAGNGDDFVGEKDYKYFWRRVLNDLTNKNLIPVKILFFFKYATLFVLYPFLTLHMNSLGLDEWEIGVNQASVPIVAILGPPVSGIIADKIGNFKIVLAFITLANAAVALLLLLVPMARETVKLAPNITFEMGCDLSSHSFILRSVDLNECTLTSTDEFFRLPQAMNVLHCGQLCRNNDSYNISNGNGSESEGHHRHHDLLEEFPGFPLPPGGGNISIVLKNQSYTFHPNFGIRPRFECHSVSPSSSSEECHLIGGATYDIINDDNLTTTSSPLEGSNFSLIGLSRLKLLNDMRHPSSNGTIQPGHGNPMMTMPQFHIQGPINFDGVVHSNNPTCGQEANGPANDDGQICQPKCFLQLDRKAICSNASVRKVYNVGLSFGIYTVFRLMLGFASATSFIMFEGAVLAILKQYGGDYGLQRVSATFAAIIAAPISGLLIQNYSFAPVFYLYAGLQAFSAVLTLKIDLKFKKPADNVLKHLKEVLSQVEILIFFLAMFCSGTAWGYLETFLFLFLQQLGGSKTLMGLTISVGGIFGLPFLIFSRPLIKRVGHVNILCFGLLIYGFRYFGYSIIWDPWLCLPFEALEGITASLAITAAATYAVSLSTLQTIATVQGFMGALYFGVGRGAGSFLGGVLIRNFGHRQTFQIMGIGSLLASLLYMLANVLYIRRHTKAGSGIDINNMNGLVISNGSAKMKPPSTSNQVEQFQMKPQDHDSDLGYGKVNPGFDDGDGMEDGGHKFTDIPLDEDNQSTLPHNNNIKNHNNHGRLRK